LKKDKYVIISNRSVAGQEWEQALQETLGVANDFKTAYHVSLFLGRISAPTLGYRKALDWCKRKGAVQFGQEGGTQEVTIVRCKWY
jgi:hypothetical protein